MHGKWSMGSGIQRLRETLVPSVSTQPPVWGWDLLAFSPFSQGIKTSLLKIISMWSVWSQKIKLGGKLRPRERQHLPPWPQQQDERPVLFLPSQAAALDARTSHSKPLSTSSTFKGKKILETIWGVCVAVSVRERHTQVRGRWLVNTVRELGS